MADDLSIAPARIHTGKFWWALAALVFFIPFQFYYNYTLNAFYHFGAPYPDGGVLAHLIWHNDWRFLPPHTYTNYSFYSVHLTLFLALLGQLSNILPTHMVEYYAAFIASVYAGLGLALFMAFRCFFPRLGGWRLAALAEVSIGFAFNDIVVDGLPLLHFEYSMPLGIFLSLLFYARAQWRLCALCTVFTLIQREDAGLHFAAVMGFVTLVRFYERRSLEAVRRDIVLTACIAGYAAGAFGWLQYLHVVYGRVDSTFANVYSGYPPYAHLSWELMGGRLAAMFADHIYLWLGSLMTFIWAWRTRDLYLPIAFVANIPWFLLNLTAANTGTGVMYSYYGFPFVLSLGWPLLSAMLRYGVSVPAKAVRQAVVLQILLVGIGLMMWNSVEHRLEFGPYFGARWGSYVLLEGAQNRALLQDFTAKFDAGAGDMGVVMADEGAQSLVAGTYHGKDTLQLRAQAPVDTLLYMNAFPDRPRHDIIDRMGKNRLFSHYRVIGTNLYFYTNRTADQLGALLFMVEKVEL